MPCAPSGSNRNKGSRQADFRYKNGLLVMKLVRGMKMITFETYSITVCKVD
jgi:hypothetical protein